MVWGEKATLLHRMDVSPESAPPGPGTGTVVGVVDSPHPAAGPLSGIPDWDAVNSRQGSCQETVREIAAGCPLPDPLA